ncbi:MAG TPA: type II toxin-antitoxin system ParD family antitoxin [Pirellulales bacterium]|nr:type II toxin-antitoxin system ParD family antitoxin [Pirellulales bacterium]
MNTDALNVSLGEPVKSFIEAEVVAGGYGSASDFVFAVLLAEQKRKALESLALEGLNSGPVIRFSKDAWEQHRQELGLPPTEVV